MFFTPFSYKIVCKFEFPQPKFSKFPVFRILVISFNRPGEFLSKSIMFANQSYYCSPVNL